MSDWIGAAPLLCIVLGGLALTLVDACVGAQRELETTTAEILASAIALAIALWAQGDARALEGSLLAPWLAVDKLALFSDVVIALGAGLAALLAGGYLSEHKLERGEFYPLLLFTAFGAMVLAR